jgi:DNA-binding Xre family transcriptional regulator
MLIAKNQPCMVKLFSVNFIELLQTLLKGWCVIAMTARNAVRLRIVDLCKSHDITINKLGTICGITQSTLNNIVNSGSKNPTISTIAKICDGLEITIREFFNHEIFEGNEQEVK